MPHPARYILAGLIALALAVFLLWPVLEVIQEPFTGAEGPLYWFGRFFANSVRRAWLFNALKLAATTTVLTALLALPLALLADRYAFPGKSLATALLMAPMILPPFVGALAVEKILSLNNGSVNLVLTRLGLGQVNFLSGPGTFWVVVGLEVLHLYPILFLNATAALANIDPAMAEAARNLGASRWRVFARITLPLMRPGLFAGATLVFIWSFCEIGTPLMVGYLDVLPVKAYDYLRQLEAGPSTYVMVFVLLSTSVGLYALGRWLFGRSAGAMAARAGGARTQRRLGGMGCVLCWLAFLAVTLLAGLPHAGVVLMSISRQWSATILPTAYTLDHLAEVFRDRRTWNAIANSLRYAGLSTGLCAAIGLSIAYLVVRLRVRGAAALDALSMLSLAVPGLVLAAGYVAITRPGSALEAIGPWRNPTLLLVVAYTVRRLPYMVRSVSAGLEQTSETLEEAARNLGASRLRTVLRITVPLILANILAGGLLTFSFNMLEVSDSLVLAQTAQHYPITKQIFELVGLAESRNLAAALGVYAMGLLGLTIAAANVLLGRRMGQLFRV